MTFRERLTSFLERYSPDQLLKTLQVLLENLIANIRNSGSIAVQVLLSPLLLLAILLLYPVVLLRKLLANIVLILKNLYKLLRKLLLIAVQEANAYWLRTRWEGIELLSYMKAATEKMLGYIQFLLDSIVSGNATYESEVVIPNSELLIQIAKRFSIWFGFGLLSTFMSVILLLTFWLGGPILHRKYTGDFPMPRPAEDDPDYLSMTFSDIDW